MRKAFEVPWTDEEIEHLTQIQALRTFHPYTCNGGRHHNDHVHDHEVILIPTKNGWECPEWDDHEAAGETR